MANTRVYFEDNKPKSQYKYDFYPSDFNFTGFGGEYGVSAYMNEGKKGHPDHQFNTGLCFLLGERGANKDETKAAEWFQKAAKSKNADALNNLGCFQAKGIGGITQDANAAANSYKAAAELGSLNAYHNFGFALLNGNGITKNEAEAVKWFVKGANKGNKKCIHQMAILLSEGHAVEKDIPNAIVLCERLFKSGYSDVEILLKNLLEKPKEISRNNYSLAEFKRGFHYSDSGTNNSVAEIKRGR